MYDAPLTVPAVLLALVLLVSGAAKLVDLETAAQAFTSLRLPRVLVRLKAPQLLPIGEIALAVLLLVSGGPFAVVVAGAAVVLFVAYLVVIVRALGFDEPVVCSCFGKLGLGSVDRFTAARNLVLVALAGLALFDATRGHSVLSRLRGFDGGQWAWLAGVLAAVALTWLISGHRGDDVATAASIAPAVDEDGDYLRVPIPFVEVRTPQDQPTTLRDLASREAVLLLIVSPTCGSCTDVIAYARTWQHTVPTLRTCLVLPMSPIENVPMLDDAADFDLLFDGSYAVARTFGVGNPSAVLLGADGKLAGGPVTGTKAVTAFMDDIADELREAGVLETADAPATPVDSPASTDASSAGVRHVDDALRPDDDVVIVTAPDGGAPQITPHPAPKPAVQPVHQTPDDTDDERLDYVPVPTPFAMFEDAAGQTMSLRQIGATSPAILLYVSPGCGSCLRVMDDAVTWQERLGAIPVYYVVTTEPQAQVIVERGIQPNRVLVDEMMALTQMMHIGTPSMFAVGPAQELLAGPVSGYDEITSAMEEILVEVGLAQGGDGGASVHDVPTDEISAANDGHCDERAVELEPAPRNRHTHAPAFDLSDIDLELVDGRLVTAHDALDAGRTLVVFLSPGCEACHDVAARVETWREQLPSWNLVVMVPGPASAFAADQYAPGVEPQLFDTVLEFGSALAIETPALVMIDDGRVLAEPARSQSECYSLVRTLRSVEKA